MTISLIKRLNPFSPKTWKGKREHEILSEKEFCKILDRERDRVDRQNGTFSIVSFNVNEKNYFSHELITTLFKRLRTVDDIGWCCNSYIGVLLHNTDSKGAKCYAKGINDALDNASNDIEYSVYTYPDYSRIDNVDKLPIKRFGSNGTQGDSKNGLQGKTIFSKHIEEENNGFIKFVSKDMPGLHSCSLMKNENLFTKKSPPWKRGVDIVGSILLIILFLPVMLVTAIAIKLTSKGPVIFRQKRAGIGGAPFTFYKFRSMVTDAEEKKKELLSHNIRTGPVFKMRNDPRVTLVGKIIRKWSIDEILQFINVLKGDMSLVGPRPPTMDEIPEYFNWHNKRLDIKPGITCIWQVYARHNKCFENWVRLDIKYARSLSFILDLKILILTLPAVISRRGAH